MVEPGNTAAVTFTTDESATAVSLGSGELRVLGTPKVVALIEEAAVAAISGHLAPSDTSVGTRITVEHLAPTGIGGTVIATATVSSVDGRRVSFDASVTQGDTEVARGTHTRFVVGRDRFMESVAQKG